MNEMEENASRLLEVEEETRTPMAYTAHVQPQFFKAGGACFALLGFGVLSAMLVVASVRHQFPASQTEFGTKNGMQKYAANQQQQQHQHQQQQPPVPPVYPHQPSYPVPPGCSDPPTLPPNVMDKLWKRMLSGVDMQGTAWQYNLWAWGNEKSSNLYVFSVGTNAMCLQYASTLEAVSNENFYVLCPEVSNGNTGAAPGGNPFIPEWVMKSALAVEWAILKKGDEQKDKDFSVIVLGGHSGGGPVALASGHYLATKGLTKGTKHKKRFINVDGYILQHPGAVYGLNVPGCAKQNKLSAALLKEDTNPNSNVNACVRYFPEDMLTGGSVTGKIMVTGGAFCQNTVPQNSAWFGAHVHSQNWPGDPWLANSSDCMVSTALATIKQVLVDPAPGGGLMFSHCGEHEHSVVGPYGLQLEGEPVVVPFAKYLASQGDLDAIWVLNGTHCTCLSAVSEGDADLSLVDVNKTAMAYMVPPKYPWWGPKSAGQGGYQNGPWIQSTSTIELIASAKWAQKKK